jgi:hypothetical protein
MWLRPSVEKQITATLNNLSRTVSKKESDSTLSLVTKTQALESLLTKDCRIKIDHENLSQINNRYEAIGYFQQLFKILPVISVTFHDKDISVSKNETRAEVILTAVAQVKDVSSNEKTTQAQELKFGLQKFKNRWQISEISTLKTLY